MPEEAADSCDCSPAATFLRWARLQRGARLGDHVSRTVPVTTLRNDIRAAMQRCDARRGARFRVIPAAGQARTRSMARARAAHTGAARADGGGRGAPI